MLKTIWLRIKKFFSALSLSYTPQIQKLPAFELVQSEETFHQTLNRALSCNNVKNDDWDLLSFYPDHLHAKVIIYLNSAEMTTEQKNIVLEHLWEKNIQ